LPDEFDSLGNEYFSLGQGEDYYETLNELSQGIRERILNGLRDCAYNLDIFQQARNEPSMQTSLLRSVSASAVVGRLHRLTQGDAELTEFYFQYTLPASTRDSEPPTLIFEVKPDSEPPTNVHVLIGRNGVGKTRTMRHLIEALLGRQPPDEVDVGQVVLQSVDEGDQSFAGLVLISFSAFDDFDLRPQRGDRILAEQVGLRHRNIVEGVEQGGIKSPAESILPPIFFSAASIHIMPEYIEKP
jgi:hypothetical protein